VTALQQAGRGFFSRDFILLWVGQGTSLLGTAMAAVALKGEVLFGLGGTVLSLAMVYLVLRGPVLLSPLAGVMVDRWSRRRTMIVSDVGRCILYLLLARTHSLGSVYVIVLGTSLFQIFFYPAYNSLLPQLAGQRELLRANAVLRSTRAVTKMAGPALAAILMSLFGFSVVFVVNAATFGVSALSLLLIREPEVATAGENCRPSIMADMKQGFALLMKSATPRFMIGLHLWLMLGFGAHDVLFWPFCQQVMGLGAPQISLIESVTALGTTLMAAVVAIRADRIPFRMLLFGGIGAMGVFLSLMVAWPTLPAVVLFSVFLGASYPPFDVAWGTVMQVSVPNEFLGRVYSLAEAGIESTAVVLRSSLAGVGAALGVAPALLLGSVALILVSGVGMWSSRRLPDLSRSSADLG